jgi:hypothetical protein
MNDTDSELDESHDQAEEIDAAAEWINGIAEEIDVAAEDVVTRRIKAVAESIVALRSALIMRTDDDRDWIGIEAIESLKLAIERGSDALIKLYRLADFPRR